MRGGNGRQGGSNGNCNGKSGTSTKCVLKKPQRYDFSRSPHVGEIKLDVNENVVALNTGGLLRYYRFNKN